MSNLSIESKTTSSKITKITSILFQFFIAYTLLIHIALLPHVHAGFFDKTVIGSSSSKKRSYDQRNQTPGSAKSDVRDETPGGKVTRKSRRFGRIAMQPFVSCSPRRGYRSHDGTLIRLVHAFFS